MYIRPKKSLGQNFLIDQSVLEQITNAVEIENKEVLEIGPGTGNLTTHILKKNPKKLYVIEKDDELSLLLNEKFNNQIDIINGLKADKSVIIKTIQDNYKSMLVKFR